MCVYVIHIYEYTGYRNQNSKFILAKRRTPYCNNDLIFIIQRPYFIDVMLPLLPCINKINDINNLNFLENRHSVDTKNNINK